MKATFHQMNRHICKTKFCRLLTSSGRELKCKSEQLSFFLCGQWLSLNHMSRSGRYNLSSQLMKSASLLLCICAVILSCVSNVQDEELVYFNDWNSNNLVGIEGGRLSTFNGNTVLGPFNDSGFTLGLPNLPRHDLVKLSIDLFVHDSWDGNTAFPNGPDIWFMEADGQKIIHSSFSNSECNSTYCLFQSYPESFPTFNNPKAGSAGVELPGICHLANRPDGTSVYNISLTFSHTKNSISLSFKDELIQGNTDTPLCDESWSVGKVEVITYVFWWADFMNSH